MVLNLVLNISIVKIEFQGFQISMTLDNEVLLTLSLVTE